MNRLNVCAWILVLGCLVLEGAIPTFPAGKFAFEATKGSTVVRNRDGKLVLNYQASPLKDSGLSVESAAYFHPVTTPAGVVLTDVAPSDHKHHRGIFLAWVEMHGAKDADFWGWGAHAPKDGRIIRNVLMDGHQAGGISASFRVVNDWNAEGTTILREELKTMIRSITNANVVELNYSLDPKAELRLARWAFSGFCVRLRKDGQVEAFGPSGKIGLPDPNHMKPETDWPDAAWYDFTLTLPDGQKAGIAVIQHPENPPTLWHNHRTTRMINPCIVAPTEVRVQPGKPLVLRYRVVAHDGPTPVEFLNRLSREWAAKRPSS